MKNFIFFLFCLCGTTEITLAQREHFPGFQEYPFTYEEEWEYNRKRGLDTEEVWEFKPFWKSIFKDSSLFRLTKYDSSGLIKENIDYNYRGRGWHSELREIKGGKIIKVVHKSFFMKKDDSITYNYIYDIEGKIIAHILNSTVTNPKRINDTIILDRTFNEAGQLIKRSSQSKITYRYDREGRYIGFSKGDNSWLSFSIEYDSAGNKIKEKMVPFYHEGENIFKHIIKYEYNQKNQKISSTTFNFDDETFNYKKGEECLYTYSGKWLSSQHCINTELLDDEILEFKYNDKGERISFITKNEKGKIKTVLKYYRTYN